MKKYEMTSNVKEFFGHKLYQIKALKDFGNVKAGDLGGYIEKEENLSHEGNAWVYDEAQVFDNALVYGDAWIFCDACVFGKARIFGNACIFDEALIFDNALIYGNTQVYDKVRVCSNAQVSGDAQIYNKTVICNDAYICDKAQIFSDVNYICFKGFGRVNRNTTMFRIKNGDIFVCCDCFRGNLKKFEEKVKETHGSSIYAKEYLACVEAAKIHFEIED